MKRNIIILLCFSLVLSFTGCGKSANTDQASASTIPNIQSTKELLYSQSAKGAQPASITLEEIKKRYSSNEIKSVHQINPDYVLIEAQEESMCNRFELYNLKTGQMDVLPTIPNFVTLEQIENENYFIFKATGKSHVDGFKTFPFYIKCFRIKNNSDQYQNFTSIREDRYYDISESVDAGAKDECLMSDLNITFDGLEVMFKPVKGKEGYFYAASTYIPSVKTSFNKKSNKLTVVIGAEGIGSNLAYNKSIVVKDNPYFSSYQILKEGGKTNLVINLKESAKNYLIRADKAPIGAAVDGFPFINIKFRGSEF